MLASNFLFFSVIVCAFFTTMSFAQNYQLLEEEKIKDKEQEILLQDYLQEREAEKNRILSEPLSPEEIEARNLVEVETNNILPSDLSNIYAIVPYRVRRSSWGHLFTITYSQFNPTKYTSDFMTGIGDFESLYGSAQTPLLEFSYGYKWNMSLGSFGGELAYGFYGNDAESELLGDATLNLQLVRAGVRFNADNLTHEPRLVPYAYAGIYTILYEETQANISVDGTTGPAIYYGGGLMLQLGWIDKMAAVEAYSESGIENTFLFAEARQFLASSEDKDPDFSTGFDLNFGLNVEF